MARKAGYEMIFTVNGQKIDSQTPMETLGRYVIQSNAPKIFAQALQFREPDRSGELLAVNSSPANEETITTPTPKIEANLERLGPLDPASVRMRISGIGPVEARYDEARKTVTYQVPKPLPPQSYTVIVTARVEGKPTEARWSFHVKGREQITTASAPTR
jgi:hypothetical protein